MSFQVVDGLLTYRALNVLVRCHGCSHIDMFSVDSPKRMHIEYREITRRTPRLLKGVIIEKGVIKKVMEPTVACSGWRHVYCDLPHRPDVELLFLLCDCIKGEYFRMKVHVSG